MSFLEGNRALNSDNDFKAAIIALYHKHLLQIRAATKLPIFKQTEVLKHSTQQFLETQVELTIASDLCFQTSSRSCPKTFAWHEDGNGDEMDKAPKRKRGKFVMRFPTLINACYKERLIVAWLHYSFITLLYIHEETQLNTHTINPHRFINTTSNNICCNIVYRG